MHNSDTWLPASTIARRESGRAGRWRRPPLDEPALPRRKTRYLGLALRVLTAATYLAVLGFYAYSHLGRGGLAVILPTAALAAVGAWTQLRRGSLTLARVWLLVALFGLTITQAYGYQSACVERTQLVVQRAQALACGRTELAEIKALEEAGEVSKLFAWLETRKRGWTGATEALARIFPKAGVEPAPQIWACGGVIRMRDAEFIEVLEAYERGLLRPGASFQDCRERAWVTRSPSNWFGESGRLDKRLAELDEDHANAEYRRAALLAWRHHHPAAALP